jgi:hypothetical protein
MVWERRKLTPSFGMELSGQSLKPGLPPEEMKAVYDAVVEHGVVVVKGQDLSDQDYANFAGSIGQIVPLPMIDNLEQSHVSLFGNIDREGAFQTGESAQMFRRQGDVRVCVATAERMSGLRDTVPVGTQLTMNAGSAAQVLLAWEEPERLQRGLRGSRYSAVALAAVRRRGWAHSVGEREPGVASVSAPVRSPSGKVIAAVSVSGPIERLSRQPGRLHAPAVIAAAERLSEVLRRNGGE